MPGLLGAGGTASIKSQLASLPDRIKKKITANDIKEMERLYLCLLMALLLEVMVRVVLELLTIPL